MTTKTFDTLAGKEVVAKTEKALIEHGFLPESVATGADALARIKELIPEGVSIMNGSSRTLEEIGFVDYLKGGTHGWNNLHEVVLAEKDPEKQANLRKHSVVSDYYLGSAHAVTEEGEIMVASNSGSQLPHLAYTSPNIILVVSTKKIVPTLQDGFRRIDEYIVPLEEVNMQKKFGAHTLHAKTLVMHKEGAWSGRKIHIIFVNEELGF
ncbi:lactate utilization protein [Candidatus Parcubacteria bacterium]|nr:lactate utilization protein [Candidatus Parcubacteria bacterium]